MTPAPRAAKARERVVFRGPPDRLQSLVSAQGKARPRDAGDEPTATLAGAEVRGLTVRSPEGVAARRATLRLPRSTPPGSYEGTADIGGETVSIVAEVEPRPRLEAEPRRFTIEAQPGGTANVDVDLVNTGNVPCEIAGTTTFCLFDGAGLEHAVWAALAAEPVEGTRRIDVLLDDLAESHGGLVATRVARGGTIAPGDSGRVRLELRFSDRLRPGRGYAGTLRIEGLRIPFRITTAAAPRRRKARVTT